MDGRRTTIIAVVITIVFIIAVFAVWNNGVRRGPAEGGASACMMLADKGCG